MLETLLWGNIVVKRPEDLLHGCLTQTHDVMFWRRSNNNGHWQDSKEQKSVVLKRFKMVIYSLLLSSFTFRFSTCRGRKLSRRSNSRPLCHPNTKTYRLPELRADCEHRLPHRSGGNIHFTFFRHGEVWPSQVWFVRWLFFSGQAHFYRRFKSRATLDE